MRVCHRVEPPLARHALQLGRAPVLEREAGPATRSFTVCETSTSPGPARAAMRAPMLTAIPAIFVVDELALAGVQAGANLEASSRTDVAIARAHRIARAGPSNAAKNPSPAVSTSRPRKRVELAPDDGVMPLDELAPRPVAELRRLSRRADDVGEQDGREDASGSTSRGRATGQELLDLVDNRVASRPR